MSYPYRARVPLLLSVASLFMTLAFTSSQVSAQVYPAPWPSDTQIGGEGEWQAYTFLSSAIGDQIGNLDLSNGGTTPQSATDISGFPNSESAYIAYDSVNDVLFFRFRIKDEPLASGVGKDEPSKLEAPTRAKTAECNRRVLGVDDDSLTLNPTP